MNSFTIKNVDPEVLRRAKIMAVEQDKPLSEILRDNLERIVREYESEKEDE